MAASHTPHREMGFREFVALVAALRAASALGIDTMLPALQQIGSALGVANANEKQWILTIYLLGFGLAQGLYGTLVDRFGRKPVLLFGMAAYALCSVLVACAWSFPVILAARALQGVAAGAPSVVSVTIVRDRYAGRLMARVMSLAFIVFLGVPVLAPSIGQLIMLALPWRGIFIALAVFGASVFLWAGLRLPETLRREDRAPIAPAAILATYRRIIGNRLWLGYSLSMTLIFGALVGFLNSSQQVFLFVFREPRIFTLIFALTAGFIAIASLLNARLVGRFGMRLLSHIALIGFIASSLLHALVVLLGYETLWTFTAMQSAMMFCFGLMMGNFGALAMEPMGHEAGSAASAQGVVTTVCGAGIGFLVGQSFNGTDLPLTLGFACCGLLTLCVIAVTERGRLFGRGPELQAVETR